MDRTFDVQDLRQVLLDIVGIGESALERDVGRIRRMTCWTSETSPTLARSSSLAPITSSELAMARSSPSHSVTSKPARAKTIAHARPISPAPTTAIFAIGPFSDDVLRVGIDRERLAGDVVAGGAGKEDSHSGNVVGSHHAAQRGLRHILLLHLRVRDPE